MPAHPLAAAVQPLIDQWLASDEGVIAECEFEMRGELLAS